MNKTSTLSKILVPKKKTLPEPMNVLKDETTGVLRYAMNNRERLIAIMQNEVKIMHMSDTEDHLPFVTIKNDDIGPCEATISFDIENSDENCRKIGQNFDWNIIPTSRTRCPKVLRPHLASNATCCNNMLRFPRGRLYGVQMRRCYRQICSNRKAVLPHKLLIIVETIPGTTVSAPLR